MCDPEAFVSVEEAARRLETTVPRVLMMLKRKELAGRIEGDAWQVSKASILGCHAPGPEAFSGKHGCGGGCGGGCH